MSTLALRSSKRSLQFLAMSVPKSMMTATCPSKSILAVVSWIEIEKKGASTHRFITHQATSCRRRHADHLEWLCLSMRESSCSSLAVLAAIFITLFNLRLRPRVLDVRRWQKAARAATEQCRFHEVHDPAKCLASRRRTGAAPMRLRG